MRGDLVVSHGGVEIHWGNLTLPSTSQRETLVKKLTAVREDVPWRVIVERMARTTAQAVRQGEPFAVLTGRSVSATRELLPRMLYEGEPTALIADGDTGKSLVGITFAAAVQSGAALPGLRPVRAVPAAYLDWETVGRPSRGVWAGGRRAGHRSARDPLQADDTPAGGRSGRPGG